MTFKIYIKNISIEDIKKKIGRKYIEKTYEIINVLTERGMYKIRNSNLFLYKIKDDMTQKIKLKSFTLFFTKVVWEKKEEGFNIPFNSHFLRKNITEYVIDPDFKIIFEAINHLRDKVSQDKISDFYFQTKIQNIEEIKKKMSSLLSTLK